MNWIVENAVMIALIRAILVTLSLILSFIIPDYTDHLYLFIFICLLTIPVVDWIKRRVGE